MVLMSPFQVQQVLMGCVPLAYSVPSFSEKFLKSPLMGK